MKKKGRDMEVRHTSRLASFVLLERDGKIVMSLRARTGYADGMYQMPSGHVEAGEYPVDAAVREVKEEVGIDLVPDDLELIHVSFRMGDPNDGGDYVDFFFKATRWSGEPANTEPEKCDGITWAALDALPENTVPVVARVVGFIRRGIPFSQIGKP